MEFYRLYFVSTERTRPGKSSEAAKWWIESGKPTLGSLSGVKSVNAYATQFGLGGVYNIEIWYELENYAVMDQWDEEIAADPEKYGSILKEYGELFESGPSRLVGDWPESRLVD